MMIHWLQRKGLFCCVFRFSTIFFCFGRIQTMSCKLLLNLVECIRKQAEEQNKVNEGRELLMRMLEVFVLKFKTIAKIQLPILMNRCKQQQQVQSPPPATPTTTIDIKIEPDLKPEALESALNGAGNGQKEEKPRFGFNQTQNINVADYRSLVKTLVFGVKTINWGCTTYKVSENILNKIYLNCVFFF